MEFGGNLKLKFKERTNPRVKGACVFFYEKGDKKIFLTVAPGQTIELDDSVAVSFYNRNKDVFEIVEQNKMIKTMRLK